MVVQQQATHWYRVGSGYSADPCQADPQEVKRVGLHCCVTQGCETPHSGSAEEYYRRQILDEIEKTGTY